MIKTFLFDLLWDILKALTGMITPSFLRKILKPLIGFLNKFFNFALLVIEKSSPKIGLGTSQRSIFPSVERERRLWLTYAFPGGLKGHQVTCETTSLWK